MAAIMTFEDYNGKKWALFVNRLRLRMTTNFVRVVNTLCGLYNCFLVGKKVCLYGEEF